MKRLVLFFIQCVLVIASSHAQTEVETFKPGSTLEGVSYYLPKTAFRVTIEAEKTIVTPGELSKYAFRYLRLQNVPTEPSTTWRIKRIMLDPYGVPDPTKAYSIKVKSKTSAPLVSLTHDGLILSINTPAEETMLPPLPQSVPAQEPIDPKQFLNHEMMTAGSRAKLAELCAQEIYDLRESRNALIRGEAENTPQDGQQLQLMLDRLETQDQALTQLFRGSKQTSTEVFSFNYLPTHETEKDVLFRFSQYEGVVDANDLSGQPVFISIQNTGNLPQKQTNPEIEKKKSKMERSVYYNTPAREAIKVFDLSTTYVKGECSMGQFGYTEILSDALFDKKMTTKVTFYQDNGAVKKLEQ
ncbi:MAG: DUF4831 family protein [Bacteroidaceae bacterium]|nr:DUF4831 family protein [Bacteroidaceae bacterium]